MNQKKRYCKACGRLMVKIRAKYEIPKKSALEQSLTKFKTTSAMAAYYNVSSPTMMKWLRAAGLKSVEKSALMQALDSYRRQKR